MTTSPEWQGEHPLFLLSIQPVDVTIPGEPTIRSFVRLKVDLDEPGWLVEHGHIFREVGDIHLVRKDNEIVVLSVHLNEGDQGYYFARHIRNTALAGEAVAYSIGKKRPNGNQDNLWYFTWGQVCGGNDAEYFGIMGLRAGRGSV